MVCRPAGLLPALLAQPTATTGGFWGAGFSRRGVSDGNILISTCLGKGFWHLRHTKNCTCRNHQPSSDSDAFCSQLLVSASAAALYPQTLEGDYCVGN